MCIIFQNVFSFVLFLNDMFIFFIVIDRYNMRFL